MAESSEDKIPEATDQDAGIKLSQIAGDKQALLPEDKRGGKLILATLPQALQSIVTESPQSLAPYASNTLLLGWTADIFNRLTESMKREEQTMQALSECQIQHGEERKKRIVAEGRLDAQNEYGTLQKVSLAAGVVLLGLAIDHFRQSEIGYPLGVIGALLIVVSFYSGRVKK